MSLTHFARKERWNDFEDAWTQLMLEDGPVDEALGALRVLSDLRQMPRCAVLVREHAEILSGAGRHEEATVLLGAALLGGGNPGELAAPLYAAAREAWGAETWWDAYADLAGFRQNAPDARAAWRSFRKLVELREGAVIYHRSGWGIGEVTELDRPAQEVEVQFRSGKRDRFPLATALDIFDVLPVDDLRYLQVRDEPELRRRIKEEPLSVLESAVRRAGGRLTQAVLKSSMAQVGLDGPAFSTWWRRTRKLAETSAWFEVTGTGQQSQIRLLDREADPAESLRRQLTLHADLGKACTRVRDLLAGDEVEEDLRTTALDVVLEMASNRSEELSHRLTAWLLVRDERGETPEPLARRLTAAAEAEPPEGPMEAPALWKLFQVFPGAREQERCVGLLQEIRGERWLEDAIEHLHHAPPGLVRPLLDALIAADRGDEVVRQYNLLLARPYRNPSLLIGLAERIENGDLPGDLPGPIHRAQALLELAIHLHSEGGGVAALSRARARIVTLLTQGSPALLERLLERAELSELRRIRRLVERGVDPAIDRAFIGYAARRAPEIFRDEELPFWADGSLWTTRAGRSRREVELKELIEVKIPANAESIGRAASYGDLSENSEWETAVEEQRTLTARAAEIERELRLTQVIDDVPIPEGIACPGTRVRYRDLDAGREEEVTILGPWDTTIEGVVSYQSPLAAALLGRRPGQRARVKLPTGEIEVEVVAIELAPL